MRRGAATENERPIERTSEEEEKPHAHVYSNFSQTYEMHFAVPLSVYGRADGRIDGDECVVRSAYTNIKCFFLRRFSNVGIVNREFIGFVYLFISVCGQFKISVQRKRAPGRRSIFFSLSLASCTNVNIVYIYFN